MAQPEAQRASSLSRYVVALAVSAVAAALLLRYWRQDLCVFVLDEPKFMAAARAQLAQHQWLSASPLVGNKGLRYGPVFFWLEGLVVGTLGPQPAMMIGVVTTIVTLAHIALAWGIQRALRSGLLPFVISAGLLAVSPCQFFWARMAWDNPIVNACAAAVVVVLATRPELTGMTCALLGLRFEPSTCGEPLRCSQPLRG